MAKNEDIWTKDRRLVINVCREIIMDDLRPQAQARPDVPVKADQSS